MPDEGTISDPRMNPKGERTFGTVFRHDDGHHHVYIKDDDGSNNPDTGNKQSRFFTGRTRVQLGQVYPVFLVVPDISEEEKDLYQDLDFTDEKDPSKKQLLSKLHELGEKLENCLNNGPENFNTVKSWANKSVIFDIIELSNVQGSPVKQPVIDKLNRNAKSHLRPENTIPK